MFWAPDLMFVYFDTLQKSGELEKVLDGKSIEDVRAWLALKSEMKKLL